MRRTEKYCPACKTPKPTTAFWRNAARYDGLATRCIECHRNTYGVSQLKARIERMRALRLEAEMIYGGVCVVCGSSVRLEFDHVNGDGAAHRTWERVQAMYRRIVRVGRPLDDVELQLLCHVHHREKTRAAGETRGPNRKQRVTA